jgi:hypothetical protein
VILKIDNINNNKRKMKYTAVILIFLGMTSATKLESSSLAQIE